MTASEAEQDGRIGTALVCSSQRDRRRRPVISAFPTQANRVWSGPPLFKEPCKKSDCSAGETKWRGPETTWRENAQPS
nr:uncharacterized protein LOC100442276 [Pongo abelii]